MTAWYITRKDLLLLAKDKRAVVVLLVLPLLFISIVGMSTGQFLTRDENSQRFKVIVVDRDASEVSRNFSSALSSHRELLVAKMASLDEGRGAIKRGEASLLIDIGPDFEERVDEIRIADVFNPESPPLSEGPAALNLSFEQRPASIGLGKLLEGLIYSQAIKSIVPVAARKHAVTRTWVRGRDGRNDGSQEEALNPNDSVEKGEVAASAFSPKATPYAWIVPGFTVMFAFFLVSVMARSFIAERDNGTLRRLLLAPIGASSILLGKTIPFFLTSVLQCGLLFICGRLLFGMTWGPEPVYLIPVILCTSTAATALGLLLATLCRTDQQVSSFGTTLILLLSSVSGCFFPRELFPPLMKRISLFTPHGWALRAFDMVLTQPTIDPAGVAASCGMLVLFAMVFFAIGWWRFRDVS